jgi:hypothetical protein
MVLQEFVYRDNSKQVKALERLNKIRSECKDSHDEGIVSDCKCPYGVKDNKYCEDLCKHSHR